MRDLRWASGRADTETPSPRGILSLALVGDLRARGGAAGCAPGSPHCTQFCSREPIGAQGPAIGAQGPLLHFKLVYDEGRGIGAIMTYCVISTKLRRGHMAQI